MSLVCPPRSPVENHLLSALPSEFKARLLPNLELVELSFKEVLYQPTNPIKYVYFPNHGVVSLVTILEDSTAAEVALVGNEGMVGLPIVLGVETSLHQAIVQVPGEAMRMKTEVFKNSVKARQPASRSATALHEHIDAPAFAIDCLHFQALSRRALLPLATDDVRSRTLRPVSDYPLFSRKNDGSTPRQRYGSGG
jgi:CRP-like cAMP-binding protein